jgi:integrase
MKWATEYLDYAKQHMVKKTYKEKLVCLKHFLKSFGADTSIDTITVTDARNYISKVFSTRTGYASNKVRKNLAAAWTWGQKFMGNFPEGNNPFQSIMKYPEDRADRYVPPIEDFRKVLNLAEGQDKVLLNTFYYTAARRGEIWNLTWDDLDFQNNRIRLWTRKRAGGSKEFDWIPMVSELAQLLSEWKEQRPFKLHHVFINLAPQSVGYKKPFVDRSPFMRKICERAGVKQFGFHAIRHLTATQLYKAGHPIALIQKVLRHTNPNTTARYIKSLGLEEAREALELTLRLPN